MPSSDSVTIDAVEFLKLLRAAGLKIALPSKRHPHHRVAYYLSVEPLPAGNVKLLTHGDEMPAYKATVDKTYRTRFAGQDASPMHNIAPTESVTFSAVDPTYCSIVQDNNADGSWSAIITPTGTIGLTQIQVNADGKIGPGEIPILVLGDIEFVAGDAVTGEVTFEAIG